jgi:DNA repair exonuclease SbcCD nuclease subunit
MVKYIIACSDIHIRNLRRQEEYKECLKSFITECENFVNKHGADSVRIVVAGDLLHNKLDISGEGYTIAAWFLRKLDAIAKTIIIAGNHDISMNNLSRLDPLSAIFTMCEFNNTIYLDRELNYESGCYVDENITWALYSSFDEFARPNIEEYRIKYPENTVVALFHGELKSAKTDSGYVSENGYEASFFEGVDFGILGHIHKRQCIENNGVPLVYCGSLIQQDHGENVSSHGYVIWDVEKQDYKEIDLKNPDFGFYTFVINGIEDIENDCEEIINL